MTEAAVAAALANARRESVWLRDVDFSLVRQAPLVGSATVDLVVVGGGFTGLWTALIAKQLEPDRSVAIVEAQHVGFGASTRNGGFISESLTHGLAHGLALWPDEIKTLLDLGRQNFAEIQEFVRAEGGDAELVACGKTAVATRAHEVDALRQAHELHVQWGEDSTYLDAAAVQADIHSPTYLAGMRLRTGSGLVNPAKLVNVLTKAAVTRGVHIYTDSPVTHLSDSADSVTVSTSKGQLTAAYAVLATNAFSPLKKSIKYRVMPIFDHVLATRPLTEAELDSIGWNEAQGVTDSGNQFHYYRLTADKRILWGGFDANYYYGNDTSPEREVRPQSHELLVSQFFDTFPSLKSVTFDFAWAGLIDSTSRFTPFYDISRTGRVGTVVGFTGLGVGSSRFGAQVILDLLWKRDTPLTRLSMVRRKPVPVPPEPLRFLIVSFTRWQLTREDKTGKRGLYLRLLDRFGVGFNS